MYIKWVLVNLAVPFCPSAFLFFRIYLETKVARFENTFRVSVWNLKWMTHWEYLVVEISKELTSELEERSARIWATCSCLWKEIFCRLFCKCNKSACLDVFHSLVYCHHLTKDHAPCSYDIMKDFLISEQKFWQTSSCTWAKNLNVLSDRDVLSS